MYKYVIKNYILCHELYIILITNFQYLMKFISRKQIIGINILQNIKI